MKIVWAAPPNLVYDQTPHYFQALFSASAVYLRTRFPEAEVAIEAAGFHGGVERFVLRHFACSRPARYLVLWSRPWEAHSARRVAQQVRRIAPDTRILVWGEAGSYIPQYFERAPFDLYQVNGDPELVIADAIEALEAGRGPSHGVTYRDGEQWRETEVGKILPPEEWAFPDLDAIDPEVYRYWRKQRGQKNDDLSFAVSRGCPINCARWCPTPRKEGIKDRRRSAQATVAEQLAATESVANELTAVAQRSRDNSAALREGMRATRRMETLAAATINRLSTHEIRDRVLRVAKADHVLWKKRLIDIVDGSADVSELELTDHTRCRLGRWYQSDASAELQGLPEWAELDHWHRQVHSAGIAAAEAVQAGDKARAVQQVMVLEEASEEVLRLLQALREHSEARSLEGVAAR